MQARLTLRTFPRQVAAMLIALVAAVAVGGSLGYTLKQTDVITRPGHTVYVQAQPARQFDTCLFVDGHRGC
jgi:hypothetical protein